MKRKITCLALGTMLLALCVPASAQQPAKIPRIGWITGASLASNTRRIRPSAEVCASWVTSKERILRLSAAVRIPILIGCAQFIAELTNLKLEVIVAAGGAPVREAKKAAIKIPIVFAQDPDPIGNGFVASLSRPGGNITGLSRLAPELSGKQVELLHEIVPKLARLAVFISRSNRANPQVSTVVCRVSPGQ